MKTLSTYKFTKVAAEDKKKEMGGSVAAVGVGAAAGTGVVSGAADLAKRKELGASPSGLTKSEKKSIVKAKETIGNNKIKNKAIIEHDAVNGSSLGKKLTRSFGRAHRRRQSANQEAKISNLKDKAANRSAEYGKKIKDAAKNAVKKNGAKGAIVGGGVSLGAVVAKKFYDKKKDS